VTVTKCGPFTAFFPKPGGMVLRWARASYAVAQRWNDDVILLPGSHFTFMKSFVLTIAALTTCVAPTFAREGVVHKTPFYRPHSNRRISSAKPRQTADAVIVNTASYESGISPGALATIFGQNLTMVSGTVLANTSPLPTRLAGVEVFVSGYSALIYGIAY